MLERQDTKQPLLIFIGHYMIIGEQMSFKQFCQGKLQSASIVFQVSFQCLLSPSLPAFPSATSWRSLDFLCTQELVSKIRIWVFPLDCCKGTLLTHQPGAYHPGTPDLFLQSCCLGLNCCMVLCLIFMRPILPACHSPSKQQSCSPLYPSSWTHQRPQAVFLAALIIFIFVPLWRGEVCPTCGCLNTSACVGKGCVCAGNGTYKEKGGSLFTRSYVTKTGGSGCSCTGKGFTLI